MKFVRKVNNQHPTHINTKNCKLVIYLHRPKAQKPCTQVFLKKKKKTALPFSQSSIQPTSHQYTSMHLRSANSSHFGFKTVKNNKEEFF